VRRLSRILRHNQAEVDRLLISAILTGREGKGGACKKPEKSRGGAYLSKRGPERKKREKREGDRTLDWKGGVKLADIPIVGKISPRPGWGRKEKDLNANENLGPGG